MFLFLSEISIHNEVAYNKHNIPRSDISLPCKNIYKFQCSTSVLISLFLLFYCKLPPLTPHQSLAVDHAFSAAFLHLSAPPRKCTILTAEADILGKSRFSHFIT